MANLLAPAIIGERLRHQREARRLTLDQAAAALHIRLRYVEALDKGDLTVFPSPAQARGFLRSYAQYLGLEAEPFLAALDGDTSQLEEDEASLQDRVGLDVPYSQAELTAGQNPPESEAGDGGAYPSSAAGGSLPRAAAPGEALPVEAGEPGARYPRTKFEEIGQALRRQREALGLTMGDVERQTRLRLFYLKALEAGDLDGLPSPVQGRGMLKNYASFLGMDVEALLLQFADGLQARLEARPGLRILKRTSRSALYTPVGSPRQRLITTDLLLAGVLILFLMAFVAWGAIRISGLRSGQSPTATAPAISEMLAQLGTPTTLPVIATADALTRTAQPAEAGEGELQAGTTAGGVQAETPTPPPGFSSASVQVIVTVRLRTWMRVTVDGKVEFEGRVLPGSAFPFAGDDRIEILTGNGAGLEVNFNQTAMGLLGTFGEAVQRVFTVQGMLTPTPTITHTPAPVTDTPTLTPTPGP
jgi:cytoskeleton protein RodZ